MCILRTALDPSFKLSPRIRNNKGDEYITFNKVPVSKLEVLTPTGNWNPLSSWNVIFDELQEHTLNEDITKSNTDIKKFLADKQFKNKRSKQFFYHGTKISPDKFNLRDDYDWEDSNGWSGDLPEGYLFLTTDLKEASGYGQYIIPCELKRTDHIFFKFNADNPSQIFDKDYGIDLYKNDKYYGFWEKFQDSAKSVLIIKGNNKQTLITYTDNVIPRTDLAIEFYNGNNELIEQTLNEAYNNFIDAIYITDGEEYNSFRDWAYEYAETNYEGFNSDEEAIEYLDWFFELIDKLPSSIKLYRILQADKKSDINKQSLGIHFTDNKDNFDDGFLQSLGFSRSDIQDRNFYIVTIKIDKNQIDFKTTITTRLSHPYEDEYTLNKNAVYTIINVEQFLLGNKTSNQIDLNEAAANRVHSIKCYRGIVGKNSKRVNATYNGSDDGIGTFWTDNLTMAKWFAGLIDYDPDSNSYKPTMDDGVSDGINNGVSDGGKVIKSTLTFKNPYIIDSIGTNRDSFQYYMDEIKSYGGVEKYKSYLLNNNYDGIFILNNDTNYYEDGTYNIYIQL